MVRKTSLLQQSPGVAVLAEEVIGFFGTPATSGVFAHGGRGGGLMPGVLDLVDELPGAFDFVAPGKEGGVSSHGV